MNIHQLYSKIDDFQNQQRDSLKAQYQCKNGCSRCCHTDISVFEIEKTNLLLWFQSLSSAQKHELNGKWNLPRAEGACAFLRNDSCTVYEARPLICRTQGLAMLFNEDEQPFLDICPLNESALEDIEENEILNLDLLNNILAQMEQQDAKNTDRDRTRLEDLQKALIAGIKDE